MGRFDSLKENPLILITKKVIKKEIIGKKIKKKRYQTGLKWKKQNGN